MQNLSCIPAILVTNQHVKSNFNGSFYSELLPSVAVICILVSRFMTCYKLTCCCWFCNIVEFMVSASQIRDDVCAQTSAWAAWTSDMLTNFEYIRYSDFLKHRNSWAIFCLPCSFCFCINSRITHADTQPFSNMSKSEFGLVEPGE